MAIHLRPRRTQNELRLTRFEFVSALDPFPWPSRWQGTQKRNSSGSQKGSPAHVSGVEATSKDWSGAYGKTAPVFAAPSEQSNED